MPAREYGYRPIGDYALIGDAHSAALVSRTGSIDWCCWPHFDSPAVFCRLLDANKGGFFEIRPLADFEVTRSYVPTTNILTTTFTTDTGGFRLTDFMPVEPVTRTHRGEDIASRYHIVRLIEGIAGDVEVGLGFNPTFDYARAETTLESFEGGVIARAGKEALGLYCSQHLGCADAKVTKSFVVREGERHWVTVSYYQDATRQKIHLPSIDASAALETTARYWRDWWKTCRYDGPYSQLVHRSALVLKLLTFEPSGALIAAPTTSLPETIGGVRNWDYRFAWLRDSALIIYALQLLGHRDEATDFFNWLDRLCIAERREPHIMYQIDGGSNLEEQTLDHLSGYRDSKPVRIGNAAFKQKQLDVYGSVLDAALLYQERLRAPLPENWWNEVCFMADETVRLWRAPDNGIWEFRGGKKHFVYSKLLCWVALDRAIRLALRSGFAAKIDGWVSSRNEIHRAILTEGYNAEVGAFTQAFGEKHLDASALVIPLCGFLPATDPRVLSTVQRIQEKLTSKGLVYRYLSEDGLPGHEGTFALCSFWLVDNLALQGRIEEARELFERIVGYANDLGLLAEEINPQTGELLGNFPQGFTHLGLIRAALHIAEADSRVEVPSAGGFPPPVPGD